MAGKEIAVKKYVVRLTREERERLDRLIRKGKRAAKLLEGAHPARRPTSRKRAKAGVTAGSQRRWTPASTMSRTRRRLVEEGVEAGLARKYNLALRPTAIFDGAAEARLIALSLLLRPRRACRWTLRLLEEKVVELRHRRPRQRQHDRADAKKNDLKPHLQEQWVIPPDGNAAFVAAHGGRAGSLQETARSGAPRGVPGRNIEATDHRDASADRGQAWTGRTARLRV